MSCASVNLVLHLCIHVVEEKHSLVFLSLRSVRYFLDENQASGGLSFFGGGGAPAETFSVPAPVPVRRPAPKPAVPDTRAADASRAAEERRRQAAAIAEEKRQRAEEAKARKAAEAEARREAAEQKRREAEEKRQQAAAQAEAKRKEDEQKKARETRAKQAQASVETAKPRATFSLASLFGGSEESEDVGASTGGAPARPTVQPKKMASPPRGTPVISDWRQNRDGSITGRVSGGRGFQEGERITTSPIGGKAIGGALVETASGTK